MIRNGALGFQGIGKGEVMQRIGIDKRLQWQLLAGLGRGQECRLVQGGPGQDQRLCSEFDAIGSLLRPCLLPLSGVMERDRPVDGPIGAKPALMPLHVQVIIQ